VSRSMNRVSTAPSATQSLGEPLHPPTEWSRAPLWGTPRSRDDLVPRSPGPSYLSASPRKQEFGERCVPDLLVSTRSDPNSVGQHHTLAPGDRSPALGAAFSRAATSLPSPHRSRLPGFLWDLRPGYPLGSPPKNQPSRLVTPPPSLEAVVAEENAGFVTGSWYDCPQTYHLHNPSRFGFDALLGTNRLHLRPETKWAGLIYIVLLPPPGRPLPDPPICPLLGRPGTGVRFPRLAREVSPRRGGDDGKPAPGHRTGGQAMSVPTNLLTGFEPTEGHCGLVGLRQWAGSPLLRLLRPEPFAWTRRASRSCLPPRRFAPRRWRVTEGSSVPGAGRPCRPARARSSFEAEAL